ncbi:DUF420 domain-containing protein [Wenyingzhuangia marina]|uniref:Putative membrane protein n=1 Tax=Wenyingzhuangia marina TaxID=1195760 RepID=A0A1M5WI51_9FLAO|nr:DUF420 domain-containing protein [Wenyingzhuangia marina]GGF80880.1 hypothetical protein GCM10011397_24850 [Wenyingzhuangia marina]SHH86903.1 putative membrane protein [Wenyingzhuangia marina]
METKKNYKKLITLLSIVIPVAVAVLFGVKIEMTLPVFLPPIYATINGITAILLIAAVISVKNGNIKRHEFLIKTAMVCSALFLVMYVLYHMTSDSTKYGGTGAIKYVYFFILISHIILSIAVIPLVLTTFVRGINGEVEKHRKMAKYTFPIWLYVAITGVIVYIMINPYYVVS